MKTALITGTEVWQRFVKSDFIRTIEAVSKNNKFTPFAETERLTMRGSSEKLSATRQVKIGITSATIEVTIEDAVTVIGAVKTDYVSAKSYSGNGLGLEGSFPRR